MTLPFVREAVFRVKANVTCDLRKRPTKGEPIKDIFFALTATEIGGSVVIPHSAFSERDCDDWPNHPVDECDQSTNSI